MSEFSPIIVKKNAQLEGMLRYIIPQTWVERIRGHAHSLEEDDLLIFKYNGSSRFDVSVFDRQSSCEKEASCFVKKCEHADVASGSRTKRHTPREYSSRDVSEAPPTKKPKLAATPTSEDTSKSSSHDEYEPPTKKKTLASTSTSADTNESSSHNEYEPPTKRQLSLHRLQHLEHGVLELMPSCRPKEIKCYVWTELEHARNYNGVSKLLQKMGR
ncbi:hypothetical protein CQW23_10867 [Capsicum baccatum]|uniref:B3 domain-containing protein n=1 Tax=Capsicum baccatum TaxID=33114 RepID=A0A2G2X0Y2_CAPBA|nr:hypothetical protein CQW23_10867 [Capsicum baccatum]